MIDASKIYTPQRAQNIMTEGDIQKVFELYKAYQDKVEYVKIVTLDEIRKKDYSLSVNIYIDKVEEEAVSPEEVRKKYFEAYNEMIEAEKKMRELLLNGGFVSEE